MLFCENEIFFKSRPIIGNHQSSLFCYWKDLVDINKIYANVEMIIYALFSNPNVNTRLIFD